MKLFKASYLVGYKNCMMMYNDIPMYRDSKEEAVEALSSAENYVILILDINEEIPF